MKKSSDKIVGSLSDIDRNLASIAKLVESTGNKALVSSQTVSGGITWIECIKLVNSISKQLKILKISLDTSNKELIKEAKNNIQKKSRINGKLGNMPVQKFNKLVDLTKKLSCAIVDFSVPTEDVWALYNSWKSMTDGLGQRDIQALYSYLNDNDSVIK